MIRITLAQLNPTLGDMSGNVARMVQAAQQARQDDADVIVFPELSLCGYSPGDWLEDPAFLARIDSGLEALRQASRQMRDLVWVIGLPLPRTGPGKPLHNGLVVLKAGEELLRYAKQLLPTYNIFDERRHFEPGPDVAPVLKVGDTRIGLLICEDGWNDDGEDYELNPFERLQAAAPDLLVSLNASPSDVGKRALRHQVFTQASRRHGLPLLYVNQVGGQDQLVFDGASFAVEPQAGVVYEAQRFTEHVQTLAFADGRFSLLDGQRPAAIDPVGLSTQAFYRAQIVLGLRDYARRCGFSRALVGCSGGIDSAVTLALAAETLGAEQVVAITLPSRYSSTGSVTDSVALCRNLGVKLIELPIAPMVSSAETAYREATGLALQGVAAENLQARIRGLMLMAYSNQEGHLLLTTGNKSEIAVGYCTLYGDTNGGLGLIGDLYKTEVFALARHLNDSAGYPLIPEAILDKPPSADRR
ncbi:MAG: NAD+ synthase [Ideonella sp. MAG2]|nr:MAG: NAD+ synthase [Ideonella sp. MAG2]